MSSSASSSGLPTSDDKNVTTRRCFTRDGQIKTITAVNAQTGDQVTTNLYGTTLIGSDVARNDVQSGVIYPDGGQVGYLVNRQSEVKQFTDQRGVVHVYDRDLLGRKLFDSVISFISSSSSSSSNSSSGATTGVDSTVQRIGWTYEVRGLLQNITSYSSAIVGQGTVVNDVQLVYNSFEQPVTEYQEHSGAVNTSTSIKVGYQYADGSTNTIRQTALIYPNGRVLNMNYGVSGGIDDALSRVASLVDNDGLTHLADYTRIGANTFVQQSSPQPQIAWSLINGTGIDPFTGLDQFDRIVDNRWYSTATSADLDRIQHGYDRASNRLWRKNTVAETAGVYLDELYAYDGINRLAELQRGQLNTSNSGIVAGTLNFGQAWGNDATGNWAHYWQNDTGSSWNLQQMRTASKANEITGIVGGGWAQPAYDHAGNMTEMPETAAPSITNAATYDAWNRMMDVSTGGSLILGNAYDGENRRVTKLASGTLRHCYFSSGSQSLEERLGVSSVADRQFVFGLRFAGDLVLRDRGAERFYALQGGNMAVNAICSAVGAVAERYLYAALGAPSFLTPSFSNETGSAYDWETLFDDFRFDSQSGLYLAFESHLSPLLGFWLTRGGGEDAFGLNGTNSYQFDDGARPTDGPRKKYPPNPKPRDRKRPKDPLRPPPTSAPRPTIPVEKYCGVAICCGPLVDPATGLTVPCCAPLSPPNLIGQVPCHCFVRFTEIETGPGGVVFTFTDYHGWGVEGLLTAVTDQYTGWVPKATCTSLGTATGQKDCNQIAKCLSTQITLCNNAQVPYRGCFGTDNSNTAAYQFATCAPDGAPATDPAKGIAGCPLGAIGYGPGTW